MNSQIDREPTRRRVRLAAVIAIVFLAAAFPVCLRASETLVASQTRAKELTVKWTRDTVREAVALWRETGVEFEKSGDTERADECFAEAALGAQMLGDYSLAEEILRSSTGRPDRPGAMTAMPFAVLSLLKLEQGDTGQADKFSRAAVAMNGNPRARAFAYFSRGSFEYYYGQSAESLRLFEKAHQESLLTTDILLQTNAAIYRTYALLREGRPFEAWPLVSDLAAQCIAVADRKCRAQAEIGKGFALYFQSDLQKSLDSFLLAESLLPRDFEYMDRARVLTATGIVYSDLGENETAVALLNEAIRTYGPTGYKAGQTTTLTFLAENLALGGNDDEASKAYLQALELARSINDGFRIGNVLEGLGLIAHRARKFSEAIVHYRNAIRAYRAAGVRIPMAEMLLANAHREFGEHSQAEELYRAAISRNREIMDKRQLAECLYEYAILLELRGRIDEATAVASESVMVTEKLYSQVAGNGLRRSFVSSVFNRYGLLLRLGLRTTEDFADPDAARSALELSERARARSMLDSIYRVRTGIDDKVNETHRPERELLALLGSRAERLTQVLSSDSASKEAVELKTEVLRLERDLDRIRAESAATEGEDLRFVEFDSEDFRRNFLDERTVLIEFFTGERESFVWIVTRETISLYRAAAIGEITREIGSIRLNLAARNAGEFATAGELNENRRRIDEQINTALGTIGAKLLGEVPGYLENKRLLIVGDPAVEGIPFGAIRQPNDPQGRSLIESNEIVFLPSARFLSAAGTRKMYANSKPGLVVSDAVYSATDTRLNGIESEASDHEMSGVDRSFADWKKLSRLAGTSLEGENVAEIIGAATNDRLSGFEADRASLLSRELLDYSGLHFATHGIVFSTEHSLSGLVLSRFNREGETVDSVLRLQDIYSMRLSADLVVLSACETGVGPELRGEGLLSLNNAFLQSGARSVVSTLWKVDDQATLELMTEFYRLMVNENKLPAEALRLAQLKLRKNPRYSSPLYWAAFTFHGDYRAAPEFRRQTLYNGKLTYLLGAGSASALILLFLTIRRRGRKKYHVRQ